MYIVRDLAGVNSLLPRKASGSRYDYQATEIVDLDTIDSYCNRGGISHIDYLKVDVEGHDLNVLLGAQSMLNQGLIRYIQFEYSSGWIDNRFYLFDAYNFLQDFAYKLYKITSNGCIILDEYSEIEENFRLKNFLATRENL